MTGQHWPGQETLLEGLLEGFLGLAGVSGSWRRVREQWEVRLEEERREALWRVCNTRQGNGHRGDEKAPTYRVNRGGQGCKMACCVEPPLVGKAGLNQEQRDRWKADYMELEARARVTDCMLRGKKKRKAKLHVLWNPSNQESDVTAKMN